MWYEYICGEKIPIKEFVKPSGNRGELTVCFAKEITERLSAKL